MCSEEMHFGDKICKDSISFIMGKVCNEEQNLLIYRTLFDLSEFNAKLMRRGTDVIMV